MAHLGPGLQGIKETGCEKVLFAPATANFPAPRDPLNHGSPIPVPAVSSGLRSPDPKPAVPGDRSHLTFSTPGAGTHPSQGSSPPASPLSPASPGSPTPSVSPAPGPAGSSPQHSPGMQSGGAAATPGAPRGEGAAAGRVSG